MNRMIRGTVSLGVLMLILLNAADCASTTQAHHHQMSAMMGAMNGPVSPHAAVAQWKPPADVFNQSLVATSDTSGQTMHNMNMPMDHMHGMNPPQTGGEVYYQCPMDKDVISDKPGKCPKCGMTLVEHHGKRPEPAKQNENEDGGDK